MSSLAHGLASPPNASRYAAPNLSFQILPIHVDGLLPSPSSKTHLKSISCNDDGIYIGTDVGEIVVLGRPNTDDEGRFTKATVRLRRKIRSQDVPVEQLAFLRGAGQSYIVALCAKTITIHRSSDLELLMTVPLMGASCFAVNEGIPFPGLAVAESSTLYLYNLQFGFDVCKPFALPEQPVSMAWMKDYVCVAYRDEYSLVSEVSGAVHELSYTDGASPLCRTLPMEEVLVITRGGALITQPQGWKISALKLQPPVRSLAFSFPYMFALSSKGSECLVEIRSVLDVTYHEILRLPPTINGKHHVVITDDLLNVYIMDQHQLYTITPHATPQLLPSSPTPTAHSTPTSSPLRKIASSQKTNIRSSDPSTTKHTPGKSKEIAVSSKKPVAPASDSPSSVDHSRRQTSKSLGTSLSDSDSPRSSLTQSSPSGPSTLPYHIPPPPTNDKNAFIRYIRTIMKQEHNPYRLLLNLYAEKIASEFPNPATARVEDVKKSVMIYLRRFLRTFSLEFKQFQSKSMRELLTVAVSISLHSLLFAPLFSIIQLQSEAQDKTYNAKLAILHSTHFHPSHFEVRPKFWLDAQSILAEEEKENAKRSLAESSDAIAGDDGENSGKSVAEDSTNAAAPNTDASPPASSVQDIAGTEEYPKPLDADRRSPDPTTAGGTLSTTSLQRYFLAIPPPKTSEDGNSSASTDGEEYAIDFRTSPSGIIKPLAHPGLPKTSEGDHFNSALKRPTDPKRYATVHDYRSAVETLAGDSDRFSLGDAKLYQFPKSQTDETETDAISRTQPNSMARPSDFSLVDFVQVSYDSEHHLYFTFAKTKTEKALAPQEWNFTFRDDERAVYWRDSTGTSNRLAFAKRRFYTEFTARYRLYEQTQAQSNSSSIALTQSYSQPSFLIGSVSASNVQLHMPQPKPKDSLVNGNSTTLDFGSSPPSGSASPASVQFSTLSDTPSQKMDSPARTVDPKRIDLRRIALEHSTTGPLTPSKLSNTNGNLNESPRSATQSQDATPVHSVPSSPSSRTGSTQDYPYCAAVRTLRLVPRVKTPREKIETMTRALSYVAQAVDEFWAPHGKKVVVGADDLVPIFSYVVALAKVPNIYSEMSYTMEFSNESSLRGKYGYSIATLQICVEHVIQVSTQLEQELEAENSAQPSFSPQVPQGHLPGSPTPSINSSENRSSPGSSKSTASPAGSSKFQRQSMRFQDLMGKVESMSHRAGKMKEVEETLPHFDGPTPPPDSATPRMQSHSASPLLSPEHSRPATPSPPQSTQMSDRNTSPTTTVYEDSKLAQETQATRNAASLSSASSSSPSPNRNPSKRPESGKFACSALEVSQPQIYGAMWVHNGMIHFEGVYKKRKRNISLEVNCILALKKSWGLFGGDGIDIYATKDRIIFFRHFEENRDQAYNAIEAEVKALGIQLQQAQ